MKFLTTLIAAMSAPAAEGSGRALLRLLGILVASVVVFSLGFHHVMGLEGREFSWWSSVYWTVVTMSTLGYGDITFQSDLGQMYSLVVLAVGAIEVLVLLPFTFIQVVYLPWRAATQQASAPRQLPRDTHDHVVLTELDAVSDALIGRLKAAGVPHVLLVDDASRAGALHDAGYRAAVGALDDPATYRAMRAEQAAMLFTAKSDETNTNVVFTWREVAADAYAVATATSDDAVDILELVGADRVLQLEEVLGEAFARRILAPTERSSIVATFEDLVVAEASAAGTPLVGRSIGDLRLRERFGLAVVGLWDRGALQLAHPELVVEDTSILVLVGSRAGVEQYDAAAAEAEGGGVAPMADAPVVVLGGGRVGRAAARALRDAGRRCCIVERRPERLRDEDGEHVIGDAADRGVLERAGIRQAPAVLVTTHDDDVNVYLTLYCRRLRGDVELLARAHSDRNVSTMHRAGADVVLSYASTGATELWNTLRGETTLLIAEGLLLFRSPVPRQLAGRALRDTGVRAATGCTVVGLVEDGATRTDLEPDTVLPEGAELVLVGDEDGEEAFLRRYVRRGAASPWARVKRMLLRS